MQKTTFLLVDQNVLPSVFTKVLKAKEYLRSNQASSTAQAARMAGISRSVFYKYKDAVYPYRDKHSDSLITIQALLSDKPGVLMVMVSEFYRVGANILTINQNIPVDGKASVSISARIDHMDGSLEQLLSCLRQLDGVLSIGHIAGD